MADKEYVCAYKYCLHHGSKVKASESVLVGKKHYHWDCAAMKQDVKDCVDMYMEYVEDKTRYPMATKIINILVFKNQIPIDFVKKNIKVAKRYYADKPVQILYGIRKLFWERNKDGWCAVDNREAGN